MASIYVLSDPRTGELRYVGQTTFPLADRLDEHVWSAESEKHQKNHCVWWLRSLAKAGVRPTIEELEVVPAADLDEAEQYWIAQFRALGFRLVNANDGGGGNRGWRMPEAAKRQISAKLKGQPKRPRSARWRRRQAEAHRGQKPTNVAQLVEINSRPVVDDLGNVYSSIRAAAAAMGVCEQSIGNSIRPTVGLVKGRTFEYDSGPSVDFRSKPVRDNLGNVYKSVSEAAARLGVGLSAISNQLTHSKRKRRVKNRLFSYVNQPSVR